MGRHGRIVIVGEERDCKGDRVCMGEDSEGRSEGGETLVTQEDKNELGERQATEGGVGECRGGE